LKRRITVTSSLNEISMDHPFLQQTSEQIFKDDINEFSSTSDICSMGTVGGTFESNVFKIIWEFYPNRSGQLVHFFVRIVYSNRAVLRALLF